MIEISQTEFERKIQDLIDGTISSKTMLAKDLKTDMRTLENKIQELAGYNIGLYLKYVDKFEFKQKSRADIDFEALIIEIIKNNMSNEEAMKKYEVGERTIRRYVKIIEKENPELISLYKAVKSYNRNGVSLTPEQEERRKQLVNRPVKIGEINAQRKAYLESMEAIYNSRVQIVGKEEAARSMGTTANRMYKMLKELYRIRIEENAKSFRNDLKVNSNIKNISNTVINNAPIKEQIKGE